MPRVSEVTRASAAGHPRGAPRRLPRPAADRAAVNGGFAVQLGWSAQPIPRSILPKTRWLEDFYTYTVRAERDGRRLHALRVGFFDDRALAQRVAAVLTAHVRPARVIDVAAGERARIENGAARSRDARRLAPAAAARAAQTDQPLTNNDETAGTGRPERSRRSTGSAATSTAPTPAPHRPAPRRGAEHPPSPAPKPPQTETPETRLASPLNLAWYLLVALLITAGYQLRDEQYLTPASGWGYALGIIGGSMMLLLLLYPLRKKARFMRYLGRVKHWFRFHMILGIVGPVLVLFHSNFQIGSLNSNVALFSMITVAVSGLVGRYFYAKIHHGLFGRKATLQELQHSAEEARNNHAAVDLIPRLDDRLLQIEQRVIEPPESMLAAAVLPLVLALRTRWAYARLTFFAREILKQQADGSASLAARRKEIYRVAAAHIARRLHNARKVAEFSFYERLFSLWHVLHYPLFLVLLFAAVLHVIAVHMY